VLKYRVLAFVLRTAFCLCPVSAVAAHTSLISQAQCSDEIVSVHSRDHVDADLLRTRLLTFAKERAPAEALQIHLRHHLQRSPVPLRLPLRKVTQVRDLRSREERR